MSTVQRRPWLLRADAGPRLGDGRFWWQPSGGVALVASHVDGAGTGSGEVVRLHPAAAVHVAVGIRLGDGVSLRLESGALLFPIADRYLVGDDAVGRSPRGTFTLGVGLDVALGAKKD